MRILRLVVVLLAVLALGGVQSSDAVLGVGDIVYDPANEFVNNLQLIESIAQTYAQLQELLPLEDLAVANQVAEEFFVINAMVNDGAGLLNDVIHIAEVFDPSIVCRTPAALNQRLSEMQYYVRLARGYAYKVGQLITLVGSAADHVTRIGIAISALSGNLQSNMMLLQANLSAQKIGAIQALQAAAADRRQLLEAQEAAVVRASWNYIQCDLWSDWPGFVGCGG